MKTRVLVIAMIIAAASSASSVFAQDRIVALFKKCETLANVDMSVIRERIDGKMTEAMVTVDIKNNEPLINEFLAAFKAEEANMLSSVEKKEDGKLVPSVMEFENFSIILRLSDKANARISKAAENRKVKAPKAAGAAYVAKPNPGPSEWKTETDW